MKRTGFVQAAIYQLSLDFHMFSFPSFISYKHVAAPQFSLIIADCYRPESVRASLEEFSILTAWHLLPLVGFNCIGGNCMQ